MRKTLMALAALAAFVAGPSVAQAHYSETESQVRTHDENYVFGYNNEGGPLAGTITPGWSAYAYKEWAFWTPGTHTEMGRIGWVEANASAPPGTPNRRFCYAQITRVHGVQQSHSPIPEWGVYCRTDVPIS